MEFRLVKWDYYKSLYPTLEAACPIKVTLLDNPLPSTQDGIELGPSQPVGRELSGEIDTKLTLCKWFSSRIESSLGWGDLGKVFASRRGHRMLDEMSSATLSVHIDRMR